MLNKSEFLIYYFGLITVISDLDYPYFNYPTNPRNIPISINLEFPNLKCFNYTR